MTEQPSARERLRRALGIIARHPRRLVTAGLLLPAVTFRLHRHGYEAVRVWIDARSAGRVDRATAGPPGQASIDAALEAAFLVRLAARLIPDASCLRKALVLRHLLTEEGIPSTIRLGVRPQDDEQRYGFHAWVEVDGMVVSEPAETVQPYSVLIDDPPGGPTRQ